MNLFDNILQGTYVIFAAGTGILPFLDLVSYTLRYIVDKISRMKFNEANNLIHLSEKLSFEKNVKDSFKLHLYATFSNFESCLYEDVCEQLAQLDKKYELNIFKYNLRISAIHKYHWNQQFMKDNLSSCKEDINKVFIVGPVAFMEDIKRDILLSEVVLPDQILLV